MIKIPPKVLQAISKLKNPGTFYGAQAYMLDSMMNHDLGIVPAVLTGNVDSDRIFSAALAASAAAAAYKTHGSKKGLSGWGGGELVMGGTIPIKFITSAITNNATSNERLAEATERRTEIERQTLEAYNKLTASQVEANQATTDVANINKGIADTNKDIATIQREAANTTAQAAKYMPWVAGTLGAGGLLLAGLGIGKYIMSKPPKPKGTIRLKMPGKKGDPESTAEVELPLNMPKMSPSLVEGLDRAVRLRTRKNIRANSYKKDPETGKLIPYDDWEEKYGKNGEKLKNPSTDNPLATAVKEDSDYALPKAASSIEFSEGVGTAANTVALYHLGKMLGPLLSNATHGVISGRTADVTGGLLAALLPAVGGHVAGKLMPARTAADQDIYDAQNNGILNYTVPGYAMYQAARRSKSKAMNNAPVKKDESNDYDDDDDWDKEASAVPQQQAQPQDPNQRQAMQPAIDYSLFRGQYVPGNINMPAVNIQRNSNMRTAANNMQALKTKLNIG